MKYLIIGLIFMSGCASVSEYNQGCRDGLENTRADVTGFGGSNNARDEYCDALDNLHNLLEESQHAKVEGKSTP